MVTCTLYNLYFCNDRKWGFSEDSIKQFLKIALIILIVANILIRTKRKITFTFSILILFNAIPQTRRMSQKGPRFHFLLLLVTLFQTHQICAQSSYGIFSPISVRQGNSFSESPQWLQSGMLRSLKDPI